MDIEEHLQGVWWAGADGLAVDAGNAARFAGYPMSASTVHSLLGCPARWLADHVVPLPPPAADAAVSLGHAAHAALEGFFALPADGRALADLPGLLAPDPEAAPPDDLPAWRAAAEEAVAGYVSGGCEDPAVVDCRFRELGFDVEIEGVRLRGSVDRVSVRGGDVWIEDYKTDRKVYPSSHRTQLALYGLAAPLAPEWGGLPAPVAGRLLYIRAGGVADVRFTPSARAQALRELHVAAGALSSACEARVFPAAPSRLCGWCPVRHSCPAQAAALAGGGAWHESSPGESGHVVPVPVGPPVAAHHPAMGEDVGVGGLPPSPVMAAWARMAGSGAPVCAGAAHPWVEFGPDGNPNPGSYAAGAAADVTSYAAWLLYDAGWRATTEARILVANALLRVMYDVQRLVSGKASLQDASNNRARDVVKQVLKLDSFKPPLVEGAAADAWARWAGRVTAAATALWNMQYMFLMMPPDKAEVDGGAIAAALGKAGRLPDPTDDQTSAAEGKVADAND